MRWKFSWEKRFFYFFPYAAILTFSEMFIMFINNSVRCVSFGSVDRNQRWARKASRRSDERFLSIFIVHLVSRVCEWFRCRRRRSLSWVEREIFNLNRRISLTFVERMKRVEIILHRNRKKSERVCCKWKLSNEWSDIVRFLPLLFRCVCVRIFQRFSRFKNEISLCQCGRLQRLRSSIEIPQSSIRSLQCLAERIVDTSDNFHNKNETPSCGTFV